jgi:hypothetical protein
MKAEKIEGREWQFIEVSGCPALPAPRHSLHSGRKTIAYCARSCEILIEDQKQLTPRRQDAKGRQANK